jgi:opacity protein-like surface antigen
MRRVAIVACLATASVSVADETAPTVESSGQLEFLVQLRLPAARGHYQPRVSFKNSEFIARERITAGGYFQGGSGESVHLLPVSRDGSGHYALRTEEEYRTFRHILDAGGYVVGWNAWDSKGTHYRYEDVSGLGEEFVLRTVTDANGNRTEYIYSGSRLTHIRYNFYDPANPTSTAAVPATSTTFASSVDLEYDASGRASHVGVNNHGATGTALLRAYEVLWFSRYNPRTFTEITRGSARRFETSFEYDTSPTPLLRAVTTPRGARYEVTRDTSNKVASMTVSGPGLQTLTTNYWHLTNRTISQDSVTRIVGSVWWEPEMRDSPARIDWGTETVPGTSTTPPQYTVFRQRVIEHTWREINTGSCVPPADSGGTMLAGPPPGGAAISFASKERYTMWNDGVAMSRSARSPAPTSMRTAT